MRPNYAHFKSAGITIASIPFLDDNGDRLVSVGMAVLGPFDQYDRKLGNMIAAGRAEHTERARSMRGCMDEATFLTMMDSLFEVMNKYENQEERDLGITYELLRVIQEYMPIGDRWAETLVYMANECQDEQLLATGVMAHAFEDNSAVLYFCEGGRAIQEVVSLQENQKPELN